MSQFLPEGFKQSQSATVAPLTESDPTDSDVKLMQRVALTIARRPQLVPQEFWGQFADQLSVAGLQVPISQIPGFTQFTGNTALTGNTESTTSGSYTDLAHVGPTLTGLAPGSYAVLIVCAASVGNAATDAWMSYSANGDSATDGRGSRCATVNAISGIGMVSTVSLTSTSNTLQAKYKSSDGVNNANFTNRAIFALKLANA